MGQGKFAVVKKARHKETGELFAIKIIEKNSFMQDHPKMKSEVEIMKCIDHPNCLRFIEVYESLNKVYIVMEMLQGGELLDRVVAQDHFSEMESARVISQILSAVDYIHAKGIVHRDIKPENVLYVSTADNSAVKLADFGLAGRVDLHGVGGKKNPFKTMCGTPLYCAPEVLRVQNYGAACDIWSIGVILYLLLSGCPPFYQGLPVPVLFERIKTGAYSFPDSHWKDVSKEAKTLIRSMLTVDPDKRAVPGGCLKHKWITRFKASELPVHKLSGHARLRDWNALRKIKGAAHMVEWMYWGGVGSQNPEERLEILEQVKRDPQRLAELEEAFRHLDYDKTGAIFTSDVARLEACALEEAFAQTCAGVEAASSEQVAEMLSRFDLKHSGKVDLESYLVRMGPEGYDPGKGGRTVEEEAAHRHEVLQGTFDFFDTTHDGVISTVELKLAMRRLGFRVTDKEVKKIMEIAGTVTETITIQQFNVLMTTHLDFWPYLDSAEHHNEEVSSASFSEEEEDGDEGDNDSDLPDAPDDEDSLP